MSNRTRTHNEVPFPIRSGNWVGASIVSHLGAILKALDDRRQMSRLFSMSEYELKDIGVTRNDVDREVMKPIKWW